MPYSIQTDDDITVEGIPDHIKPDAPELRQRVMQVRLQRQRSTPEYKARREAESAQERDRLMREAANEVPWYARGAANVGAGYTTLAQGFDQLIDPVREKLGLPRVVSDDDIREKRERDRYLAGNAMGKVNQLVGEIGPTMVVPAAAYAQPVATLSRFAPLGPTSQLLAAGATGGAANAMLSPTTSDESRGLNATIAAGIGAVVPGAGVAVPAAVRGARKLLTEAGAEQRAVEMIADHLGDSGKAVLEKLGVYSRPTLRGAPVEVPTSAAQATGDARLAQLEAASRSKPSTQPSWADFDAAQNAQRYGVLEELVPSELRLQRLDAVRAGRTGPMRERALADAAQAGNFADPVLAHVDDVLQGASSANPAVRSIANYVQRELSGEAGTVSPQRLYSIRQTLAGKLSGPSAIGDELAASAKGAARETTAMIGAIDDALDAAAGGGQWRGYLSEYGTRSKPITSGRAMRDVAEKIEAKPLRGTTPEVTYAGMQTATRGTEGKYGDKLVPAVRADVDNFMESLRQAEAVSRTRKIASTAGGGSITNTDQQLSALTSKVIEALPGVGGYAKRIKDYNVDAVERQLARLLQSPTELGAALRALPERQRAQVFDEALRASGVTAGAEATR